MGTGWAISLVVCALGQRQGSPREKMDVYLEKKQISKPFCPPTKGQLRKVSTLGKRCTFCWKEQQNGMVQLSVLSSAFPWLITLEFHTNL